MSARWTCTASAVTSAPGQAESDERQGRIAVISLVLHPNSALGQRGRGSQQAWRPAGAPHLRGRLGYHAASCHPRIIRSAGSRRVESGVWDRVNPIALAALLRDERALTDRCRTLRYGRRLQGVAIAHTLESHVDIRSVTILMGQMEYMANQDRSRYGDGADDTTDRLYINDLHLLRTTDVEVVGAQRLKKDRACRGASNTMMRETSTWVCRRRADHHKNASDPAHHAVLTYCRALVTTYHLVRRPKPEVAGIRSSDRHPSPNRTHSDALSIARFLPVGALQCWPNRSPRGGSDAARDKWCPHGRSQFDRR